MAAVGLCSTANAANQLRKGKRKARRQYPRFDRPPKGQRDAPPPPRKSSPSCVSSNDGCSGFENITAAFETTVRFNKFQVLDDANSVIEILPLTDTSYPFPTLADANLIRDETTAVSVFYPKDCLECRVDKTFNPEYLLEASNVVLNHPSTDEMNPFWDELWEVILAQIERRNGGDISNWMTLPETWQGFNMTKVAEAVHDEYPGSHHVELIKVLFGGALDRANEANCATCANVDRSIIPMTSQIEFLRGAVMLADLNTWAFGAIGPINFSVKWHFGRARPEEVMWKIYNDELTTGVPSFIRDAVKTGFGNVVSPFDFTAYPEGSPCHPSFPAMHAASSASSLWMAVVMDLTKEQHCRVKALDYAIAYARTIAGVHYASDNIAGLNIGQTILAKLLPDYLAEKYGANKQTVVNKIEQVMFDWTEYTDGNCFH